MADTEVGSGRPTASFGGNIDVRIVAATIAYIAAQRRVYTPSAAASPLYQLHDPITLDQEDRRTMWSWRGSCTVRCELKSPGCRNEHERYHHLVDLTGGTTTTTRCSMSKKHLCNETRCCSSRQACVNPLCFLSQYYSHMLCQIPSHTDLQPNYQSTAVLSQTPYVS